jgi:hypothetical protein
MQETTTRFTVGVFQDAEWAARGLAALARHGFEVDALSCIAKATPEADALVRAALGREAVVIDVPGLSATVAVGSLVEVLEGADAGLRARGLAATMRRAGFQAHDGAIFERLVARGGILVGVDSEARAADALATLHAYGAGNAAIGAWAGRLPTDA